MKKFFIFLVLFMFPIQVFASGKLPGNSIADAVLQRDTLIPVYAITMNADKGSKKFAVVDTQIIENPHDLEVKNGKYVKGEWKELWTVKTSNKKFYIPVKFILDNKGCTYVIENKEIKIVK